jgi:hypothetical protein
LEPIATLSMIYLDREQNEGTMRWRVSSSADPDAVFAAVFSTIAPRIAALSDAELWRVTIEYRHIVTAPEVNPAADVSRRVLLLFENADGEVNALTIFSPIESLFEATGPYAGIRVVPSAVEPLVNLLVSLPFRTSDDRPFGALFLAGSLAY